MDKMKKLSARLRVERGRIVTTFSRMSSETRTLIAGCIAAAAVMGILFQPGPPEGVWRAADGRTVTPDEAVAEVRKPTGVTVVPGSASKLYQDFRRIGYRLEAVRKGAENVPRVFVKAIPRDIRHLQSVSTRKAVFIKTMLPLILRVNEDIRTRRARIQTLSARAAEGKPLTAEDRAWLDSQYERYGVEPGDSATLLRRVDVVPPSLALAQAAEESGWGTSRFAIEGRALFGQRTYSESARGLKPRGADGSDFKVRAFGHLLEAVRAYVHNLNTHGAYLRFRKLRAAMREGARSADDLNSMKLVETLERYSERGQAYVRTIKTIIRANDLHQLDGARLSENLRALKTISGA